jgi:flagellar basal body-associated protein FliL
MEALVICISIFIVLCALATCGGVFYVWRHDKQRRYAAGRVKPTVDYDPWMSFVMPRETPPNSD